MNVRWVFLLFSVAFSFCHVNGFYSHKCKEAETASDTIGRLFENANCTLAETSRKFQSGMKTMHNNFKLGVEHFKNKFVKTTKNPSESSTTNLDYNIDVRMLTEDDAKLTTRPKRDASDEGEEQGKREYVCDRI